MTNDILYHIEREKSFPTLGDLSGIDDTLIVANPWPHAPDTFVSRDPSTSTEKKPVCASPIVGPPRPSRPPHLSRTRWPRPTTAPGTECGRSPPTIATLTRRGPRTWPPPVSPACGLVRYASNSGVAGLTRGCLQHPADRFPRGPRTSRHVWPPCGNDTKKLHTM